MRNTVATIPPPHASILSLRAGAPGPAPADCFELGKGATTALSVWVRNRSGTSYFVLFFDTDSAPVDTVSVPLCPALPIEPGQTLILDVPIKARAGLWLAISDTEDVFTENATGTAGSVYALTI